MGHSIGDIVVPFSGVPVWKEEKKPKYVYHYTNTSGLMGIVNSKTLWAADVWYMNDTGEATYGVETVTRFLDSCVPESDDMRNVCAMAKSVLSAGWAGNSSQGYISCLSESGDQLSQWRSYGYGRGFSIAFDLEALLQLLAPPHGAGTVGKVIYDQSTQRAVLSDIYQHSEVVLARLKGDEDKRAELAQVGLNAFSTVVTGILARSMIVADFFKNPAFSEEREVRIYTSRQLDGGKLHGDVKFRESPLGVTPYVTIPLCPPGAEHISVIRKVIIGPQPHQREAQRAIHQFFIANGMPDVEIRLSEVPLRA